MNTKMMMLTTIPFSGFYESLHDSMIDDEIAQILSDDHGDYNDGLMDAVCEKCDFRNVHLEYAKGYAASFVEEFNIKGMEFDNLESPREYNFTTDRIFVKIPLSECERIFREVNIDLLIQEVKDTFTSCDGFVSYYSNDLADWGDDLTAWDHNQLGTLLSVYAKQETTGDNFDQLAEIGLMESSRGNGEITGWVEESTPNIERLYRINEYLEERKSR